MPVMTPVEEAHTTMKWFIRKTRKFNENTEKLTEELRRVAADLNIKINAR